MHTLSDKSYIHRMKPDGTNFTAAAGATAITSDHIDMATPASEAVLFRVAFGAIVSSAVTSVKVQHSDASGSGYADVAGTSQTVVDTADNTVFLIEVYRPVKRYLRLVTTRGTANATIDYMEAQQFRLIHAAPTQSATIGGREVHNSPISGTA